MIIAEHEPLARDLKMEPDLKPPFPTNFTKNPGKLKFGK
jgi:hypothetical protein